MSKELRIGVPGAGGSAFAVSRDSGGILIGVRDNAAPQFAVSRDSEGLLLSAWPVAPTSPTLATGRIVGETGHGGITFGFASVRPIPGRTASVRSSAKTGQGTANPYLVAAPSTIAAGDMLVMALAPFLGDVTAAPDGWTLLGQAGDVMPASMYARTATVDDEGATSYAVGNGNAVHVWAYTWAIADALDVEFSAFCYEPAPGHSVQEVISADGFPATVGAVFCAFAGGSTAEHPQTANNDPAWTEDAAEATYSWYYAWHAVWGS